MKVGAALASAKAEVRRLTSKIDRVRERSEEANDNWKYTVNRAKAAEGRKRDQSKRPCDNL